MLLYVGIHDVDITPWMMHTRVTRVYAQKAGNANIANDCDDRMVVRIE